MARPQSVWHTPCFLDWNHSMQSWAKAVTHPLFSDWIHSMQSWAKALPPQGLSTHWLHWLQLKVSNGHHCTAYSKNPWDVLMFVIKFERDWLHFNDFFLTKKGDFFFSVNFSYFSFVFFSRGIFFSQNFNYTTLEIWIKEEEEEEEEALLHSMQIIIELKEMDETKITLSTRHKKFSAICTWIGCLLMWTILSCLFSTWNFWISFFFSLKFFCPCFNGFCNNFFSCIWIFKHPSLNKKSTHNGREFSRHSCT